MIMSLEKIERPPPLPQDKEKDLTYFLFRSFSIKNILIILSNYIYS